MPSLICIEHDGTAHRLDAQMGQSVMRAIVDAAIPGIIGDCGGACSCATCHAYVDDAWIDRLPSAGSTEQGMLECAIEPRPGSRLTCQIEMSTDLDGLVIRLPASQI
ncbi:2Fe-2S iron-sulfur cluster-binding protein [Paraburkholderia dinghuensis]|uniref:(2Fe-2S)-binding protein n=1 Tax=Paraburkholderia dinghuensis TaxID=2305225 RepID=A0A3N6N303_9BURK|nr:2Fe-2S iron-sulfur cluster-binding protein [Paraburkholderia dinghuensis]RQH04971.1 (2Fe-2S)-binding protein [Paraburkholderia dinghuensis]